MDRFDELAKRLSEAATAHERVEAAERLSELDDPRVAPTLAKALADPDSQVRERVEAILGAFCRRDRKGHLTTLLDEAERVAALLSAEASRLRGEARDEPRPRRILPIEPPEGFDGACALVRLSGEPVDMKRVSHLVAAAIAAPPFEVTRGMQMTKGFLARGVQAELARRLVNELAAAGVVAGAVPVESLPEPLKVARLRGPRFDADGLRGHLLPSGEESVAWGDVELAVAARVEMDLEAGAPEEGWSVLTRPLPPRGERRRDQEPVYEYVVEILAREPARRLRLLTYELDFKRMHRRPLRFARVARLGKEVFRRADRRRVSAGIRRLADLDEEGWHDLTFTSPVGYEDYVTWQRLLLALGVPLPR